MGRIHTVVGILGAASIVLGAAWAAWPVAQTDTTKATTIHFPFVVHGAILAIVGLGVAVWAMNAIRKEKAQAFSPPRGFD